MMASTMAAASAQGIAVDTSQALGCSTSVAGHTSLRTTGCQCHLPRVSKPKLSQTHCSFLPPPLPSSSFVWGGFQRQCVAVGRKARRGHGSGHTVVAGVQQYNSNDFEVQRLISTFGYINISNYTPPTTQSGALFGGGENSAAGYNRRDLSQMSGPEMVEGAIQTRLYAGRIVRGDQMGTRVLLKAYPGITSRGTEGMTARGTEVDVMAANELASHAILQEASSNGAPENIAYCLGGFQTRTGEQWLVFQDSGQLTAADYAKEASQATLERGAVGQWEFWDRFDKEIPMRRRLFFITKLLRGAFSGLAFMHANGLLHQSLGPASIILNTMEEREVQYLVPQLRDLAFAVDVSDISILSSATPSDSWDRVGTITDQRSLQTGEPMAALSAGLWRRAASAGARTALERKAFGIADDIYAAGLLLAYMVFVSLCEPGSIDGPSLQRLLENTFRLDIPAAREYFIADDRWVEAVKFLDLDDGAGWQLLQAMLNPNFRMRPTAEAVLIHRFMTGAVLDY